MADHHKYIRQVIEIARSAHANGNRPFGALLISANGEALASAENSQLTGEQVLAHAEMVLLHDAVRQFSPDVLQGSTIYTSAEPCAMCAGAIFWSGVGRLVFGLSGEKLHQLAGKSPDMLLASSGDVLAQAGRKVEVVGPILEDEAMDLFANGVF